MTSFRAASPPATASTAFASALLTSSFPSASALMALAAFRSSTLANIPALRTMSLAAFISLPFVLPPSVPLLIIAEEIMMSPAPETLIMPWLFHPWRIWLR